VALDGDGTAKRRWNKSQLRAAEHFPHTFARVEDAVFGRAGEISDRYSR